MSVRLAGTSFGLGLVPMPSCPGWPCAGVSRTLTAPVTLGESTSIALALSIFITSNGDNFFESSQLRITGVRFYDDQGHVLQPVEISDGESVPETGTLFLVLSGFGVLALTRRVTSCRTL